MSDTQPQPARRRSADPAEIKARTAAWMEFEYLRQQGLSAFEAFLGALDRLEDVRRRQREADREAAADVALHLGGTR